MHNEHAFAPFIKILGKGKKGSRSLTQEEACAAFGMILRNEAEPVQVGAFLMLLRVKEESAEELAGFVQAVRKELQNPADIVVDLDWPSYAGKRKHLPWFILSALLLAQNNIRVFMHGSAGHTTGRIYTESCFRSLGLPVAENWQQVQQAINQCSLCFFPLRHWCEPLQQLIDLRSAFGLRSPVHTLIRLVNPLASPTSLQSIFHPAYAESHSQAAQILGQHNALVIKGDGGEFERRPEADCKLFLLHNQQPLRETWPRRFEREHNTEEEIMDPERLLHLWRGTVQDKYAETAVIDTAALALRAMNRVQDADHAIQLAAQWWQNRNRQYL